MVDAKTPTTAYIAWALIQAGYKDTPEVQRAIGTVREFALQEEDAYNLALVANALAAYDPNDSMTRAVVDKLYAMRVQEGERVVRGQQLCTIGQYATNNYHLHFDIAPDPVLKRLPGHWPGDDPEGVRRYYTDPMAFIRRYHVAR